MIEDTNNSHVKINCKKKTSFSLIVDNSLVKIKINEYCNTNGFEMYRIISNYPLIILVLYKFVPLILSFIL